MWSTDTFKRHLCALFITSVVITSLVIVKKEPTAEKADEEVHKGTHKSIKTPPPRIQLKHVDSGLNNSNVIHILGLFELTTKWGERSEGKSEIAAAKLAIQHVNNFKILPEYTLELLINDTKCDPGVGIDRFFHAIYSKRTILMLLGTSCSNVTESLAHVVPYWNILQISFGSTSPSLSDRNKFPLFFRTVAPDSSHNAAKVEFVKYFGWKVVATFSQSEDEFLLPLNNLITELERENISCITTITFSLDNYKEQLKTLKNSDIRIIMGSFSHEIAPKIFCEIYSLGMYGTDYVWILQDRLTNWWQSAIECPLTELIKAVDGVIIVSDYDVVTENDTSISGLYNDLFETELNMSKGEISKYARSTYDAIWAMALSVRDVYELETFKHFNYQRSDIACEFVRRMSSLNFMGISGPVKFIGADRIGRTVLRQIQGDRIADIAIYDSETNTLNFHCAHCRLINWWMGRTPIAQRILKISLIGIPKSLFYSTVLISILGIAISLLFFYFNWHFRRIKTVKISSPKLNNVAVIGCILVYISVILQSIDSSTMEKYFSKICSVRVYLLSAGSSLAFGSMFAKTYRVHRIYYGGPNKVTHRLLKDNQLIALILIPLIIDAVILTLWIMIDPMKRQLYNLTLEINSEDRGVVYQPQVEVCRSQNTGGWFLAIYGYKGLILIMGAFMAWETRHVKVQALNDSHYIGICVYGAVFSAIITVLSDFINEYVVLSYLARTISILTSTTVTLFLLFLPKLKTVFSHQHTQDPIMQSMGLKLEYNTRRFIKNDLKEQILRLEIQNKVYRSELVALDLEIQRLEDLLLERKSSETEISTIYKNDWDLLNVHPVNIGRSSWPTTYDHFTKSHKGFLSENKLDAPNILGKMKRVLSNFRLNASVNTALDLFAGRDLGQGHKSNPEFHTGLTKNRNFTKSEVNVLFVDRN